MADRQVDRGLRVGRGRLSAPDVAVVGGGIVGVSAAVFLAEAGAAVELFERGQLAGAASGRNSGSIQHPFDPALVELHEESLAIYRDLELLAPAAGPAGILTLARGRRDLEPLAESLARSFPELRPALVDGTGLTELEPALAPGLAACRLETGYPLRPLAATLALGRRARRAGALVHEGAAAVPVVRGDRVAGLTVGGKERSAGAVVVAAGPWTPGLVGPSGGRLPIEPVWGAVAEVTLADPPRHVLEEAGVERVAATPSGSIFSLVTAEGASAVGSTFSGAEPVAATIAPALIEAGAAFVPALGGATLVSTRACARPQSADGRPLIGPVAGIEGLHVAAGHGPWGISLGPASGRLAARIVLGTAKPPAALEAARFGRAG